MRFAEKVASSVGLRRGLWVDGLLVSTRLDSPPKLRLLYHNSYELVGQ